MDQKIKKYFSIFNRLNKKWLFLALLFFVVLGLFFTFQPALAQIADIKCPPWTDPRYIPCITANFILSILIKIVVLLVFALPLLISAFVVGIVALILGWIISPDFISLKFTQNPFVDIGLSITKGFANMGFILFLVVIALATILRIEEYKAKKTLPTLILIALLINFSPVLCGAIIDFTNIVMDFFLSNIGGINGFVNFIMNAANSLWNSLWNSGLDLWKNIAAAMQVIIGIAFNWFAAFIFILFCALFIMRYIMLWILVILSPIAFVSYILPITRRGQSLLNWREWWKQLTAWSIIGIIAGFFLYLGFTMISLINANPNAFVTQSAIGQLGLMNNILPYLIPLVLLWVAYRETKRTSAMFAKEIVEAPEKIGKAVVQAGAMLAVTAATAGAGAAIGAAGKAGGGLRGAIGTMSDRDKWAKFREKHKTWGSIGEGPAIAMQEARSGIKEIKKEVVTPLREEVSKEVTKPLREKTEEFTREFKEGHPEATKYLGNVKKGLKTAISGRGEEDGRELTKEEREQKPDKDGKQYRYEEGVKKEIKQHKLTDDDIKARKVTLPNGETKPIAGTDLSRGYLEYEEEVKEWKKTKQELTKKEIDSGHLIDIEQRPGLVPIFKNAMKTVAKGFDDAVEEQLKKMGVVVSLKVQKNLEKINELIAIKENRDLNDQDVIGIDWAEKILAANGEITMEILKNKKAGLEKRAAKEIAGVQGLKVPKVSETIDKIFGYRRKKPKTPEKKDESEPSSTAPTSTPTKPSTGPTPKEKPIPKPGPGEGKSDI